jgi:hypothetical protein
MTQQEADQVFRRELEAAIENARANRLRRDIVAYYLRSNCEPGQQAVECGDGSSTCSTHGAAESAGCGTKEDMK